MTSSLSSTRFSLINENKNITNFYQQLRDVFWNPQELNFTEDKKDYFNPNIKSRYKELYKLFLEFFAVGDGIITEQAVSYLNSATSQEERMFLILQLLNEQDHVITYTRAITEVLPKEEREGVFTAVDNIECVKAKKDFVMKYSEGEEAKKLHRSLRYFAGALSEGIFFTSLFAIIFYFRRKNIFGNFITANKFILRDETIHRNFNIYMTKFLRELEREEYERNLMLRKKELSDIETEILILTNMKNSENNIDDLEAERRSIKRNFPSVSPSDEDYLKIAKEAYEIELAHLRYIFSTPIDTEEIDEIAGISPHKMELYIQTLTDQVLSLCNLPLLFNIPPTKFEWMEDLNLLGKENFYETLVTKYTHGLIKDDDNSEDENDF